MSGYGSGLEKVMDLDPVCPQRLDPDPVRPVSLDLDPVFPKRLDPDPVRPERLNLDPVNIKLDLKP